jgi:hypothetical protein
MATIDPLLKKIRVVALEKQKMTMEVVNKLKEEKKREFKDKVNAQVLSQSASQSDDPHTPFLVILMRKYWEIVRNDIFVQPEVLQILACPTNSLEDEQVRNIASLQILQMRYIDPLLKFMVAAQFNTVLYLNRTLDIDELRALAAEREDMIEYAIELLQATQPKVDDKVNWDEEEKDENEESEKQEAAEADTEEQSASRDESDSEVSRESSRDTSEASKERSSESTVDLSEACSGDKEDAADDSSEHEDDRREAEAVASDDEEQKSAKKPQKINPSLIGLSVIYSFAKLEERCAQQDPVLIRGSALHTPKLTVASNGLFTRCSDVVKTRELLGEFSSSLDDLTNCQLR